MKKYKCISKYDVVTYGTCEHNCVVESEFVPKACLKFDRSQTWEEVKKKIKKLKHGWNNVKNKLPKECETVFVSNGQGYTTIGCLIYCENKWQWATIANEMVYEENGKIFAECEASDFNVKLWHKFPKTPKLKEKKNESKN